MEVELSVVSEKIELPTSRPKPAISQPASEFFGFLLDKERRRHISRSDGRERFALPVTFDTDSSTDNAQQRHKLYVTPHKDESPPSRLSTVPIRPEISGSTESPSSAGSIIEDRVL